MSRKREVNRALDMAALQIEREAAACVRGLARWRDRSARCLQFAEAVRAARGVPPVAGSVPSALDALTALLAPDGMQDEKSIERTVRKAGQRI